MGAVLSCVCCMVPAQAGLIQPVLPGTARGSQTQAQGEQTWPPAGMDGVCLLGGMPSPGACGKQQKRQMAQQSKAQHQPQGRVKGCSPLGALLWEARSSLQALLQGPLGLLGRDSGRQTMSPSRSLGCVMLTQVTPQPCNEITLNSSNF